jgi:glycosyltransferase involved in cell wall biosynthesis
MAAAVEAEQDAAILWAPGQDRRGNLVSADGASGHSEDGGGAEAIAVSVVVCTHNRARLLPTCVESLRRQTLARERFEIVVVDNASSDETPAVSAGLAAATVNLRVVREPRLGKSFALNAGCRESRGGIVAFIDDDGRAAPDWLERIVATFRSKVPTPAAVGGELLPIFAVTPPTWFPTGEFVVGAGDAPGFLAAERACWELGGCNVAFRKDVLVAVGGFDSSLGPQGGRFRFGEDSEILRRVIAHTPYVWYDPAIRVEHLVPAERLHAVDCLTRAFLHGRAVSRIEGTGLAALLRGRHRNLLPYVKRLSKRFRSCGNPAAAASSPPSAARSAAGSQSTTRADALKRDVFVTLRNLTFELGRLYGAGWR